MKKFNVHDYNYNKRLKEQSFDDRLKAAGGFSDEEMDDITSRDPGDPFPQDDIDYLDDIDTKFKKITEIFSCKNESDILSEFFFIIANLYSSEEQYENSNLFLNIANFLNPKFRFNTSLIVENNFGNENYKKTKALLNRFNKKDEIYYWYKIKKITQIISQESNQEEAINYINSKFSKIENPSTKILFDMGNIAKGFKKYQSSINYFLWFC